MGIKKKNTGKKNARTAFFPHPSKHTNHESWEIRPSYDMGNQSGKEDFRHTSSFVLLKDFHPSRAQCQEGRGKEDGMGWGSQSAKISCRPARYETPCPRGGHGETYWAVWETRSLSFSHIVLYLFQCPPFTKAINATKDNFAHCVVDS